MTVKKAVSVASAETALAKAKAAEEAATGPQYYVAIAAIDHNGVRAHNIGDKVPAANVIEHGWQDLVTEME